MDSLLAPNDVEDRYGGVPLGAEAFVAVFEPRDPDEAWFAAAASATPDPR
ncbi:MAG TPA: hypothetical protein VEA38_19555 [Terriglobales bacterium]|nr:hypothetical protein [Terriglobales bacterium]HYG56404.1 hypothetical protein [Burkholderiales bacterium]